MSRDLVFATLALCVCGLLAIGAGLLRAGRGPTDATTAARLETTAWLRLWLPLCPALGALAALLGWAAQEPAVTDEILNPRAFVLAALLATPVARAGWRALRALRASVRELPAATVGLLRPRVIVSTGLRDSLSATELAAVEAHEEAHARHRDPLRIWLAQLATDLQWPSPAARRRLTRWLAALELARDEEARRGGVAGDELAAAVVTAARLATRRAGGAVATLTPAEANLAARVQRLLAPLPDARPDHRLRAATSLLAVVLIVLCALGVAFGDDMVRALPIITTPVV